MFDRRYHATAIVLSALAFVGAVLLFAAGSALAPKNNDRAAGLDKRFGEFHVAEAAGAGQAAAPAEYEEAGYNRHIRSILTNNCFACHGPDENSRRADLRLDSFEEATRVRDGRAAIVPGDPEASELYRRVTSDDPELQMPPADVEIEDPVGQVVTVSHEPLPAEEIELLRQWIEQGAEYEEHWAFIPPERPEVPAVEDADWPLNEVDHFVLARLEAEGIEPSPEADRETLIRRVTLDLTGLPPTPAEVQAFVNDDSPDAFEKVVDRLFDSKAYGERMAVHWLDQVRYADTTGYHSDEYQPVWAFRDYVIRAFNANMPFDQFTREQLAGDLFDDPTMDQLVASSYNRLNMTTAEGGAQEKEYLAKYMADRVEATGSAFMGASMSCAQCHDHKYDPYTIKDFYEFGAFFADIEERGLYEHRELREPTMEYVHPDYRDLLDRLRAELTEARDYFELADEEQERFEEWRAEFRKRVDDAEPDEHPWLVDRVEELGEAYLVQGDWDYVTADEGPVMRGEVSRRQDAGDERKQHYVRELHEPVQAEGDSIIYLWVYLDPDNPPDTIMLELHTREEGWNHRAFWGEDKIPFGGIGNDTQAHRPMGDLPETGEWVRLEVLTSTIGIAGHEIDGFSFTQHAGLVYYDELGVDYRTLEDVPVGVTAVAHRDLDEMNEDQRLAFFKQFRKETDSDRYEEQAPRYESLDKQIAELHDKDVIHEVLTTQAVEPREVRVLPRGNWMDDSGEVVEPSVPDFLGAIEKDGRADRMDLANWLLSEENPLMARAVVNRFWSLFFGTGVTHTPEELGSQGEMPTHPELLDWLAMEFRESGWDVQHILRTIVASRTYRQASQPRPELRETDPDNRLLARQSRFRLEAEFIRDNALMAAGLLNKEMFGPPIKPYQPDGYWDHLNFPMRTYEHDTDENQWRRGLYIHRQRTFLHPMLMAFDAPSREMCVALRERSNTPLQALVLLNDPSFVEAARVFAEHMLETPGDDPEARIGWAFQRAVARQPEAPEVEVLRDLYETHLEHYRAHPDEAAELLEVGLWEASSAYDPAEIAAWTSVARTLLNLHETITRY